MTVYGEIKTGYDAILTHDALKFVSELHKKFEPTRQYLLCERVKRQKLIDAGENLKVRHNFMQLLWNSKSLVKVIKVN